MQTSIYDGGALPFAVYHPQKLRRNLLAWYDRNRRDLPWRRTRDPYRVWISEIMLQQTRVGAALPYYERFVRRFPTVRALAKARPQAVFKAWAGLGYYTRARSLHETARVIAARGAFPRSYEDWLALPGIGPYTAAAISSIALGLPHAVLDGNVRRVLSRLYATADGLQDRAQSLLDPLRPGDFNQALMELGATVCLPRNPRCDDCPIAHACAARRTRTVDRFPPAKARREPVRHRLDLALVQRNGWVLLARPGTSKLWRGFWTLPELPHPLLKRGDHLARFRHTVTFRDIHVNVCRAAPLPGLGKDLQFVRFDRLSRLALSTPSRKALSVVCGIAAARIPGKQ